MDWTMKQTEAAKAGHELTGINRVTTAPRKPPLPPHGPGRDGLI